MGTSLSKRRSSDNATLGDFPLAANPSILLHILTSYKFDPQDLARLEATCSSFKQPANFAPDFSLSLPEVAALDMCLKRTIFKSMTEGEREALKRRCGGSWKLVLKFLLAGEFSTRREKPQVIAAAGHSVVVTSRGEVYTFGKNTSGQLGLGTLENQTQPQLIRSLQGIRIIQAAAGPGQTRLVRDDGRVYAFGEHDIYGAITEPKLMKTFENIFVVQTTIGHFFTAVLSREGRVYTCGWGTDKKLGHGCDWWDRKPRPLLGPLENLPVVQIAAGHCYLAALAFQPHGMSVYTVGCGSGGKLGHDSTHDEEYPRLVKHLNTLNLQPVCLAAGAWHTAVVGRDGRVCTWGWGRHGCLGFRPVRGEYVPRPRVVGWLRHVKAVYVAAGVCTTFVISDAGDVYLFGLVRRSSDVGRLVWIDEQAYYHENITKPRTIMPGGVTEKIVQVSDTNSAPGINLIRHTLALTESGKLYAFGSGDTGQLGIELSGQSRTKTLPERVHIDLN